MPLQPYLYLNRVQERETGSDRAHFLEQQSITLRHDHSSLISSSRDVAAHFVVTTSPSGTNGRPEKKKFVARPFVAVLLMKPSLYRALENCKRAKC